MGIPGQFSSSLLRFHNTSYQCHLQEHSRSRVCFGSERRNTGFQRCFPSQPLRSFSRSTAVPVYADTRPPVVPGGWTGIGTGKEAAAGGASHTAPSGGCRGSRKVTAASRPTRARRTSRQHGGFTSAVSPINAHLYAGCVLREQLRANCRSASVSSAHLGALPSPEYL